ncbi:hypothetical protein ACMFMF_006892 [Clarireedia jacksonii]
MGQMEDEYFVGFGLEPYGDVTLTFQYDTLTGYIYSGLYLLYATTGHSPPVIRTGVVGYEFDPPGFPLVCKVSTVDLSLSCRADGQIYARLMLVDVNGDGLLELAIGNGATAASTYVSTVELYLVEVAG